MSHYSIFQLFSSQIAYSPKKKKKQAAKWQYNVFITVIVENKQAVLASWLAGF